jgi:hypothetical protein
MPAEKLAETVLPELKRWSEGTYWSGEPIHPCGRD